MQQENQKNTKLKAIGFIWLLVTFILFVGFYILEGAGIVSSIHAGNIGVALVGLMIAIIVYGSTAIDSNMSGSSATLFRTLIVILSAQIIVSCLIWMSLDLTKYARLEKALAVLYVLLSTAESLMFFYYAQAHFDAKFSKYMGSAILLGIIAAATAAFSLYCIIAPITVETEAQGFLFGYLPGASIMRLIMAFCSRAIVIWIAIDQKASPKETRTFLICPLLPMVLGVAELFFQDFSIIDTCFVLSLLVVYSQISIKRGVELVQKETELTEQKVNLMISQIQPHFIFNALNTICYLCRKDPRAAEKATSQFAAYLRTNIDSLSKTGLIPFAKEMSHVKTYVELEQMRFADKLEVLYDLQYTNFLIPQLTLQPLVENAVKHGICEKENGGIVKISSIKEDDFIVIKILDNGVGFDQELQKEHEDDRVHVGISNVAGRIETMCGGSLEVYSIPGTGTLATVKIPVKE